MCPKLNGVILSNRSDYLYPGLDIKAASMHGYIKFPNVTLRRSCVVNDCQTSNLRIASHMGSNPVRDKPLFP